MKVHGILLMDNHLPSPGGGAQLDGASLSQAGEQEKTSLVAKLIDEIEDPLYFTMY